MYVQLQSVSSIGPELFGLSVLQLIGYAFCKNIQSAELSVSSPFDLICSSVRLFFCPSVLLSV